MWTAAGQAGALLNGSTPQLGTDMLPINGLQSTDVANSKNPLLRDLWVAVTRYNLESRVARTVSKFEALGGRVNHQKARALHEVMVKAGIYLTSKPPQPGKTNRSRWDAIRDVAEAASLEAEQIGVKLVHGPADFRRVSGDRCSVWLEVIDPMHRDMGALSVEFKKWVNDPTAIKKKSSFWGFGNAALTVATKDWMNTTDADPVFYDTMANSLVEFDNGKLVDSHGARVDTLQMNSFHTGRGWGIFACDTRMRFFVSDHHADNQEAWIRHTTLAAGSPVLSAGEIVVENGRIRALSNETGHYRLPYKLFLRFICQFAQIPGDAIVKVFASEGGESTVGYATCDEIRRNLGDPMKTPFKEADWARSKLPHVGW